MTDYETQSINEMIENYQSRKERLWYDYQAVVQPYANPYKTQIVMEIDIPTSQEVKYIPGVLQTLKFAWVQYLSLLIPSMLVFWGVTGFVFRH